MYVCVRILCVRERAPFRWLKSSGQSVGKATDRVIFVGMLTRITMAF